MTPGPGGNLRREWGPPFILCGGKQFRGRPLAALALSMVAVRPFKAMTFDWEEVQGGPEQVTSLPYDVLSPKELERMKKSSEHNVTHLTLPAPSPGKGEETKYREAERLLKRWRKEGILYQLPSAVFYLYQVTYDDGTRKRTANGLGCLVGLDPDYEEVRAHERTHKGPITDRFELLKATSMDLEPIQFLYRDPEGFVMEKIQEATRFDETEPALSFTDSNGTRHSLWPIKDAGVVAAIREWFESRHAYIADGHHRYATALAYAQWRREQGNGDNGGEKRFDNKLAVLMEANDPGLSVHPTHRLVQLDDANQARETLRERFSVQSLDLQGPPEKQAAAIEASLAEAGPEEHRFVYYWGSGQADVVKIATGEVPAEMAPERSPAWRRLDVSVLHHHVLPGLGITQENAGERLRYTREALEAVTAVPEEASCSILMKATPQQAVLEVADAKEHMPQKSTYFLPKLQSGLFFSPL